MRHWKQATGVIVGLAMMTTMAPVSLAQENGDNPNTSATENVGSVENKASESTSTTTRNSGETPIPKIRLSVGKGQSTPNYNAEQKVELKVKITNEGSSDANNIRISPVIDNASDFPFQIENMNEEKTIEQLKAGESAEATWNLTVRSDVETKSYKTSFDISYDDGTNIYQASKYIYVNTTAKKSSEPAKTDPTPTPDSSQGATSGTTTGSASAGDSQGFSDASGVTNSDPVVTSGSTDKTQSVPRVIVTGFSTDPANVNAGSDFKLTVHVKNTSKSTAVSNLLFDMQAPSSGTDAAAEAPAFLPSSGSSSIYLDSIPADATRDISIDLNARSDLIQKPYSIAMSMKYEDGNATQYEASSSLAIPVKQAARFEFSDIELAPDSIQVGEESNLTCSIYNTGRIKMYNVKVKFSGGGISGKDVFVGNIDSGATGTIDGMVTGESEVPAGSKCKMTMTYEDESGKSFSQEKEFEIEVTPMADDDNTEMVGTVDEAQKSVPVIPIVIAVIVVAAVVIALLVIRKKKKKQLAQEEEDLADEVDRLTEDE